MKGRGERGEGRGIGRIATLFFLLVLFPLSSYLSPLTFAEGAVRVKSHASPARVTLGDEIRYYVRVEGPPELAVEPLSPKLKIFPFEIKNVETLPSRRKAGSVQQTFLLTLTVFELGDQKIPPLAVRVRGARGETEEVSTKEIPIKVVSVGKRPTDRGDIRPIKGPVSFDLRLIRDVLLGLLALALAVLLAVKATLRIRRQRLMDLESLKPPHERAFLELERLRKKEFLEQGRPKEFYSEFADILRRYLERRFGIETLELTTPEILRRFREKELERGLLEKMAEVLENADLVKFAKFTPPRNLEQRLSEALAAFVESTKQVETETAKKT